VIAPSTEMTPAVGLYVLFPDHLKFWTSLRYDDRNSAFTSQFRI